MSCANLPPNSTCTVSPANASLTAPSNIQVAIATGVGSAARVHRAGMLGWLPWPIGLVILITHPRRNSPRQQSTATAINHVDYC